MRHILLFAFMAASCCALTQSSPEKGCGGGSSIVLTVYHADGTTEIISEAHGDVSFYHTGAVDTTVYTLEDTDSVVAKFRMINDYIPSWPFHEELMYGVPVVDTSFNGYSYLGGGSYTYDRIWSFADSAMFSFYFDIFGNPLHVIRLIYKQSPAAVTEGEPGLKISVFPNPASANIYIQFPVDLSAELLLIDASGRQVKSWKSHESHTLDLSQFQPGSYLLRIVIDGNATTFRVQKSE